MKPVFVSIDTSKPNETSVSLHINGRVVQKATDQRAQTALLLLDELLAEHQISYADISEILVNAGPGSFTGLRVGAAIANALGFLLSVPINGSQRVIPSY